LAVVDVVGFWALALRLENWWKRQLLFEGKLCHSVLIKTLAQSHSPRTRSNALALAFTPALPFAFAHVALHLRRCKWEKFGSRVFGLFFGISFI